MLGAYAKELIQAEKLLSEGNFTESLQILESLEKRDDLTITEQIKCHLLKGDLMNKLGKLEEALKLSDLALQKSEKNGMYLQAIDARLRKANVLWRFGKLEESLNLVTEGEEIVQKIIHEHPTKASRRRFSFLQRHRALKHVQEKTLELTPREASLLTQKGSIYWMRGRLDEALELFQQSLVMREKIGNKMEIAESSNSVGIIYAIKGDSDRALRYFEQCSELFAELNHKQNYARTLNNIGNIYASKGELDQALEYYHQSLTLGEEIGNKQQVAQTLNNIGNMHMSKGELNQALEYCQRSLDLKREIGNELNIAESLNNIGMIYWQQRELNQALEQFEKCLALFEELNNKRGIARSLNNSGIIYMEKGDLKQALTFLKRSLTLKEEIGNNLDTSYTLFFLILITIDKNKPDEAQKYLQRLQEINAQEDNKIISQRTRVAEALLLKTSSRVRNWGKAVELLEQIVEEEMVDHELTVLALLTLCDLLLGELRMSDDLEVLKAVKNLVKRLLEIAKQQNSFWLLAETYVLQSKLALLELDIQSAQSFLTQAQLMANKKGLQRLVLKISNEHDALLDQISLWEELVTRNATITERAELAHLDDLVTRMIRKTAETPPDVSEEEPVWLLILDDAGLSLFSKIFLSESKLNEHMIGGFLTAIQAFSAEAFSQTIDRVKLEEYTLLMKAEAPFQICYIFKGASYLAQQKLTHFAQNIRKKSDLWLALKRTRETGQTLNSSEQASLESLLTETFQIQ
ncbi:MAG: tetratricopeptide repeat protein [Candidatus Hodarchaeota archaeon]